MSIRIGQGIDIHPFAPGRRLVLGGVEISSDFGLAGHSDADVLLHAVMDALLGAVGWGDIGEWFPGSDAQYKDADSSILLLEVWQKVKLAGWELENLDLTLLAEVPRIKPYREQILDRLASLFDVPRSRLNLKATTTEKLGFVGRKEGILATAVVLLSSSGTVANQGS